MRELGDTRRVPLAQGLLLHRSILFSQLEPVKLDGQRQVYPPVSSCMHVPPLKQGPSAHLMALTSQFFP